MLSHHPHEVLLAQFSLYVHKSNLMLLSYIGEYASEYNEYVSLQICSEFAQKMLIDSEYFHLSHPSTSPYKYVANALRMLANALRFASNRCERCKWA